MSSALLQYAIFDLKLENKTFPLFNLNYSYFNEHSEEISLELNDNTVLDDKFSIWEFRRYGLKISGDLIINNPEYLFGEDGLIGDDGIIGISLHIASRTSSHQYIKSIGEIRKGSGSIVRIPIDETINKESIYGSFRITIRMYVKEKSSRDLIGKANIVGMLLGDIFDQLIEVDGDSSAFPIQKISDSKKPLWYVEYNFDDPTTTPFTSDYICIYLNESNPAFKHIEKQENAVAAVLQNEIIASALTLIIAHLRSLPEWSSIENGVNLDEGSIGAAIHYFISTFNWNFDTQEKLSESIRYYFEKLGGMDND